MKIVVIGMGKIGQTIIEELCGEGHELTAIDLNPKKIEDIVNNYDVQGIVGNGVNYDIQMEAGVKNAELVIAAAATDEINMLACLVAEKIGAAHTVARIRDPEYSRQFSFMLDTMGLDMVVNPEFETASEISRNLRYPSAVKIDTFSKGRIELVEYRIGESCPLNGMALSKISSRLNVRILVCAVQRKEQVIIPGGDFVLTAGDRIHFTAAHSEMPGFFKAMGEYKEKPHHVMLIGGGRIAYYLTRQLSDAGMRVKVIECDRDRCVELTELLPRASVICGEGTDPSLLREENLAGCDACVAITGIDEENVMISLYAKKLGVPKILTKINKTTLSDMLGGMLEEIGLDSIISPRQLTANRIVRYVRAMEGTEGSSMQTLYRLVGGRVEALEFKVEGDSALTGRPLRELSLKPDMLITCINRGGEIIIPGGGDCIRRGDHVIVVAAANRIRALGDILR